MKTLKRLILVTCLWPALAEAQTCLTVSPSGSGSHTGADWNNSLAGLPSTFVRGDIYYLADGTYGAIAISSATGTGYIEIRKAQSYDNCSSVGWNTATMGSSQAVFTRTNSAIGISITIDQVIINGNGQASVSASMPGGAGCGGGPSSATDVTRPPVTPSDCGIKAINSCTNTTTNGCDAIINLSGSADNFKFLYMEWQGLGAAQYEQYPVRSQVANDNTATRLFQHIFQHDFGANILYTFGHRQVDHSYFWGNQRIQFPSNHGQYSYDGFLGPITSITEFNNVYRDIQGTAIWGIEDGPQVASNFVIYNNFIISTSPPEPWMTLGVNNGTVACLNGSTCSNFVYVNNTHVNTWGARIIPSYQDSGTTTSGWTIQNNLWYGMVNSGGPITKPNGTESNNSFLNSGTGICFAGTADVCTQTSGNPFVNSANFNYNLSSDGANWNNRFSLGSPYNVDAAGNAFTTDRGAYQFAQFTVTLTVVGSGISVSDSLGGIVNCTSLTSPCVGTYSSGSDTLTATATSQHQLLSWAGACASQYPTCTLAVTSNLSITANAGGCGPPTYPCTSVSTAAVGTLSPAFSSARPFNSTTFFTPLNPNVDCLTRFIDQNIVQYGTNASGTVNTSGTSVTFVSGNNFVNTWGNSNITINGVVYQIAGSPLPSTTTLTLTTSAGTQTGVAYTFAGVSLATTIGAGNLTTGGGDTNQMSSINAAYLAIVANGVNWIFQTNTQGSCIQNNTNGGENPSVGVVGPFGFSRLTDTVFYYLTANHILNQGTVNSSAIPMTFTVTNNANFPFDFDNCPAAGTGAGSSSSFLGIASNDSTFGLGIVWGGGGQGTGHLLFVYTLGVGCATLDVSPAGTSTTAANWYAFCSGNCSPTGTNVPPSGTSTVCFDPNAATGSGIHDAQLSLSGNVLEAAGGCFSPLGVGNVVMWQAGTSNILGLGQSGSTWDGQVHYSGHNTFGFASALITNNPFPNNRIVDPLSTTNLGGYFAITPLPSSIGAGVTDYHGDWPEPLGQPHDINYWIVGSHNTSTPTTPLYLENMVFGLSPTAGTLPIPVFGPEFATGSSPYFGCGNSILYASQNAKWAVFITDDLNNLGTDANGNPLCSVYVYALDGPAAPPVWTPGTTFLGENESERTSTGARK